MYGSQGRKDYTRSVLDIITDMLPSKPQDLHKTCPQANYQKSLKLAAKKSIKSDNFIIPTYNRFNVLGN